MRKTLVLLLVVLCWSLVAGATTTCAFTTSGTTMTLTADCITDESIVVPDGFTLDGNGNTITAQDPPAGEHFRGAVVKNGGSTAHVHNLAIDTSNLQNACDAGGDRLRGIMFDGASGSITHNAVTNINQGASGCQEGNAIEVRSCNGAGTSVVEVTHNQMSNWQKTGIVANCDVDVVIEHNTVSASATQANLAANGIQVGFGGKARVRYNLIEGNSWCCPDAAATAVLLFQSAAGTVVSQNNIMGGNADVGIFVCADHVTVDNNRIFETGSDGSYDIGLGNYDSPCTDASTTNSITNNKVRGYDTPYDGVSDGKNKSIPSPQ
jgi:hypothetical protein